MATIVYLDPEDEITSAASRIRQAPDTRVALVVPFGSRVATSRINFRLLAREAMVNGRRLDIVAPDASARALAASAGIPVFASVAEYEAAFDLPEAPGTPDTGADPDAGSRAAGIAAAGALAAGVAGTGGGKPTDDGNVDSPATASTPAGAVGGFATPGRSGGAVPPRDPAREAELDAIVHRGREEPAVRKPRRSLPVAILVGVIVLLVALGAAAVAGYLLLPSAEITVTPRIQPVGPVAISVTADPSATTVDEAARVIPAETLEIPVQASGEFTATGKRVEKTKATGGVRWRNCDNSSGWTIPKGTLVRTSGGTAFTLDETVVLPSAVISGGGSTPTLRCQFSEVGVTAVVAGKGGNVPARAITVIPARYNRTLITVSNPQATSGGSEKTFTRVAKKDVDAAMASLQAELEKQFTTEIANPDQVPDGSTAFPETAALGAATPSVDPATLVNQEVESFTLSLDATGTMLAVDPSPVEAMAAARLATAVTPGYELVDGSTQIEVGDGTVKRGVVTFTAGALAKETRPVDGPALQRQIVGLPAADARALLEPYGDVKIVLWPDWVDRVPAIDARVTLVVADPVQAGPEPTMPPQPTRAAESPGDEVPSQPLPSG
jgi:hypothetical protein